MLMQSVCNTLVIVEMYMVSKKPFDPMGKRKWVNYAIIIIFVTINAILFGYFSYQRFDEEYQSYSNFFFTPVLTLTMTISLSVSFLMLWRLNNKGTSKELKSMILRRHF